MIDKDTRAKGKAVLRRVAGAAPPRAGELRRLRQQRELLKTSRGAGAPGKH